MAIDTDTPRSPGWWIKELAKRLHDRRVGAGWSRVRVNDDPEKRPGLALLDDYHRGEPPLPACSAEWRDNMRAFLRMSRMNYTELVIGSALDRMIPLGWRTAADADRDGDQEAAALAAENNLQLVFGAAIEDMLSQGDGYTMLGEPRSGSKYPVITAEDPQQVITAHDARTGEAIAGLKMFRDEWDSADMAYLYLPDSGVHLAVRRSRSSLLLGRSGSSMRFAAASWDWKSDEDRDGRKLPGDLAGRVPIARLRNRGGVAEHEKHLDVLDRINNGLFDRVTIAKYQAFRQRGIKNLPLTYPPDHPDPALAGKPIDWSQHADMFEADPGSLWNLPAGSEVWESAPVDLGPLRLAIRDDVEALAAVTRTPLHYITPDAASGSAEGASTMKEAHLFRVEDRQRHADVGIADTIAMAFLAMGDEVRADRARIETMWAPSERFSLQQRMSAATQAKAAGLPQSSIYTDVMGYRPQDLVRLRRERAEDLLHAPAGDQAPPARFQEPAGA